MCDRISHMKFKTDRIVYIHAEKKGQEEYTTKSQPWLLLGGKWDMVLRAGKGISGKCNSYILYTFM